MTARKPKARPMQLSVVLKGDQQFAENVILEVKALARRHGLEIPTIKIKRKSPIGPKLEKLTSRHGHGSKARRKSPV